MSAQLRQVAAENQAIVEAGRYRTAGGEELEVASVLAAAFAETRFYDAAELTGLPSLKSTTRIAGADPTNSTTDGRAKGTTGTPADGHADGLKTTMDVTG